MQEEEFSSPKTTNSVPTVTAKPDAPQNLLPAVVVRLDRAYASP